MRFVCSISSGGFFGLALGAFIIAVLLPADAAATDEVLSFLTELESSRLEERLSERDPLTPPDRVLQIIQRRGGITNDVLALPTITLESRDDQTRTASASLQNRLAPFLSFVIGN